MKKPDESTVRNTGQGEISNREQEANPKMKLFRPTSKDHRYLQWKSHHNRLQFSSALTYKVKHTRTKHLLNPRPWGGHLPTARPARRLPLWTRECRLHRARVSILQPLPRQEVHGGYDLIKLGARGAVKSRRSEVLQAIGFVVVY